MSRIRPIWILSLFITGMALALLPARPSLGQGPQGQITLWTDFPGITVQKGTEIKFTIKIINETGIGQILDVAIASAPSGWQASLMDRDFGTPLGVKQVYVKPEPLDSFDRRSIYFRATPPEEVKAGNYEFVVEARPVGTAARYSLPLTVALEETAEPYVTPQVKMTTEYSALRAVVGGLLEYPLRLENNTPDDLSFNLSAQAPQGWDVLFRPSYERKYVGTVEVKAGYPANLWVEVTPPATVEAGDFPMQVRAESKEMALSLDLMATIIGRYEFTLYTATGRLNAEATAGQESPFTVYVANTGSMPIQNLSFVSASPSGWLVKFDPDRLSLLLPNDIRQLDVTLKPDSQAIAGDYSVVLFANSERIADTLELRVAVGTTTVWGWVGLGIVLVVLAGLAFVFVRVGRR